MTAFWLGLAAGAVLGVALCIVAVAAVMIWGWFRERHEGEWPAPADW